MRHRPTDEMGMRMSHTSGAPLGQTGGVSTVEVLDRPVYGISEAARLLGLRPRRVRAWLDGYERAGHRYPPVVRTAAGAELVTWGEFVELGYLREYRLADVALQRIRPVINQLRQEYGTPYPLAHHRPWVYDRELVLRVQEQVGLDPAFAIVVRTGQQLVLSDVAERFVRRVEFEADAVVRWRPAGPHSPVVVDPLRGFGMPQVGGVATERIFELIEAGESIDDVAAGYDLPAELVRNASAYEETTRRLAA